jgi:predicted dehydrogenase
MPKREMKPIAVAVVALGRSGWDIHVAALRNDARYRIVSVFDPEAERRQQAERELGCTSYADYGRLLKESPAELVVVASPSVLHGPQSIQALEAGQHHVFLFAHQNYRFHRRYTFVEDVVRSRKLGKLTHVAYCAHSYARRNDWQCLKKYSGGVLNNKVTHPLDQILALVKSPVAEVLCDMKHISDAGDVEDHVKMLLRTESGVTIDIEDSTSAATVHHAPDYTILGTCGAMTITGNQAHLKYYDPRKAPKLAVRGRPVASNRKYGNEDVLPWQEEDVAAEGPDPGTYYDAVYRALRLGRKFPIDPREVREMMRVIGICRKQNPTFPGR